MNQNYDSEQNFLLNFPNLNSDFGHQQNLAFLAQDLLNEAQKFQPKQEALESESDESVNDQELVANSSNGTKRRAKQNNGESKKHKNQFQRKNIKKIIGENRLNESTLKALQDEQERQMRLNIDSYKNAQVSQHDLMNKSSSSSSNQSVLILDNETGETGPIGNINDHLAKKLDSISRLNKDFMEQEKKVDYEDLTLSDDEGNTMQTMDDDDDCLILSESEHQQEEACKKKAIRGIHMNDDLNQPDQNGQVLVNVNHPAEDPDIYLIPFLAKNIKPHQIGGIRFIYDNIVESLSRVQDKQSGFGCILAHAMGLGKTFQIITFIEVFLRCRGTKRVLCIVPINTIQNWMNEFNHWLPEDGQQTLDNDTIINYKRPFKVYLINDTAKTLRQRTDIILSWKHNGGVLLIGYEMFRALVSPKNNLTKKNSATKLSANGSNQNLTRYIKQKDADLIDLENEEIQSNKPNDLEEILLTPCLVVCDEGHRIKNSTANIAKTLQRIETKRRIVLTGYPLQNNLIEYWCMVDFVRPSYLGNKAEFSNMFERPIMNGQCIDSTRDDIKLMRYRAHVLHSLLEGFVQRRGHDVFICSLPKKHEFIIQTKLSPVQKELYLAFMQAIGAMNPGEKTNPLRTFAICCKIWNHPDVLYKHNQDRESELDLDLPELQQKLKRQKSQPMAAHSAHSAGFDPFACPEYRYTKPAFDPDWASAILQKYRPDQLQNGAKLLLAFSLIEESVKQGDKILLFSQSLLTLNLIEDYLQRMCVPNTDQPWQKYRSYCRLDGSTSGTEREKLINSFNRAHNGQWLFLLSTRAGCLGINLIGANRVIVLDASWNPCHDAQAVCRVFRYGQTKNSFVYRLIADHTMEKKIYERQVGKQTMSDRVVDQIQSENHFTRTEVEKLIHYVQGETPAADLSRLDHKYNDPVLVNACIKHAHVITKEPYTHESLLIDKKEYQLSEREKAMAFKDYHHDKRFFPYARSNSLYYNSYNSRCSAMATAVISSDQSSRGSSSTSVAEPVMEPVVAVPHAPLPSQNVNQLKDVKISSFVANTQISIPTSNHCQSVSIQPGEKVYILKTPKGCYLRTPDKRYIALRSKSVEDSLNFGAANESPVCSSYETSQSLSPFGGDVHTGINYYQESPNYGVGQLGLSNLHGNQPGANLFSSSSSSVASSLSTGYNTDLSVLSADNFQNQMMSFFDQVSKELG
ncbi:helicase ARIP4-like isoform X1 [Brachionus plicatilis]|uniref:Helicase ARIP4-like isoform X1 n=1 Tax=Brachionus plicatilis TaxID=10195 RepID=A0A3M7PB43_BRAPC|nr:helicase ARIP4-like isoform X1 [Brachionus plicatilis]